MATNSVENILKGAKDTLAKANNFTKSAEGTPTSSFAPKSESAPESTKSPLPSYRDTYNKRKSGVKALADQAGSENTKPREDAMKALTGGSAL